jgi:GntR family transcriptional regulator, phosphonate transport system regulatory protein
MAKPSKPARGRPKQSSEVPLTESRRLDRSSEVPLYFQLAAALKAMLEVGTWEPGARFASERELEEEFNVSRAVIRPALELLVGDGAIRRVKGSGAFVAPPRREIHAEGLVKMWCGGLDGRRVEILSVRERRPDRVISHFLELEDKRPPIAHVTALVNVGEPSITLVDSYSSVAELPWLIPLAEALQAGAKLPKPGRVDLTRATIAVEHTFFGEWGASQVGATAGEPALMGRFVQFGRPGRSTRERPLEFARLIYRADCAQLCFELS